MCHCTTIKKNSKHIPYVSGKHKILKVPYTCLMCLHPKRKFAYHNDGKYSTSRCFECDSCHEYARYYDVYLDKIELEMFFLPDYNVIMTRDNIIFERKNHKDIIMPFFIFSGKEDLIKKVKTYTLFS